VFNLPPGKYLIGTEYSTGKSIVITVLDGPKCGRDCDCCEYNDGTAPSDHMRDCDLITLRGGDWCDCSCEGAEERAKDRKRVRLLIGRCPIDEALYQKYREQFLRKENENG